MADAGTEDAQLLKQPCTLAVPMKRVLPVASSKAYRKRSAFCMKKQGRMTLPAESVLVVGEQKSTRPEIGDWPIWDSASEYSTPSTVRLPVVAAALRMSTPKFAI